MICDIFIRSYRNDFEWLGYCLRSIHKFATGFRNVVVVVPTGQNPPTGAMETVFHVHENCTGYMHQQLTKLHADAFTDAEFILFMDSDTIFTRQIRPSDAIREDDAVRWLYTPRRSLGEYRDVWARETIKAIGFSPDFEFMRRHPLCAPRWALRGLREFFWRMHGMSLESYIIAQPGNEFSEWNALGAWLWKYHPEKIAWQNTDIEMGVPFVRQEYSHGGLTDVIREGLELTLK